MHIHGAVSLIVWYLLAIVSLKYVYFLLRLDNHGEGGVFALLALAKANAAKTEMAGLYADRRGAFFTATARSRPPFPFCRRWRAWLPPTINNVVNPAAWANPWIASLILAVLFAVQRFGTDKISKAFAPIMLRLVPGHCRAGPSAHLSSIHPFFMR